MFYLVLCDSKSNDVREFSGETVASVLEQSAPLWTEWETIECYLYKDLKESKVVVKNFTNLCTEGDSI